MEEKKIKDFNSIALALLIKVAAIMEVNQITSSKILSKLLNTKEEDELKEIKRITAEKETLLSQAAINTDSARQS